MVSDRKEAQTVWRRFGAPLLMIAISAGTGLIAVELILQVTYRDVLVGGRGSPSGVTFYKKYYKHNSWGFRDVERAKEKEDGVFRILVLGDSFTYGSGIKHVEDLYPALLEEKLNRTNTSGVQFEVINTGDKGMTTAEELAYLRETGLALSPDLVIVGHVLNDAETRELKDARRNQAREATILPSGLHKFLSQYSFTYYLALKNLIMLQKEMRRSDDSLTGYDAYLDELYRGDNLAAYRGIVADLAQTCAENGLPVLWVSFPRISRVQENPYPFDHVAATLRDIALEHEFAYVDLQPAIQNSKAERLTVSAYDGHPNEIVHALAAEEIYRRLVGDRLVPMQPSTP